VNQSSECDVFLPRNANIISEMIFSVAYISYVVCINEIFKLFIAIIKKSENIQAGENLILISQDHNYLP
jgi:hypothetical protein